MHIQAFFIAQFGFIDTKTIKYAKRSYKNT